MHKKKSFYLSIIAVLIILSSATVLLYINSDTDFSTIMVIGCDAISYEQKPDIGYLTLDYKTLDTRRNMLVKVEDAGLQKTLSQSDLAGFSGANLRITIPLKTLKEQHIDKNTFNAFYLLRDNKYDEYLTLLEAFF